MADSNFQGVSPISFIAGGTITRNKLVKLDSTEGRVVVTAAITDLAVGVALNDAAAGELVSVQTNGKAKLTVSGVVTLGDQLMPTGSGAGKCVTAAGATAKSVGIALQTSAADGEVIEALLATPAVNTPANS